jgi:hypothetical protein
VDQRVRNGELLRPDGTAVEPSRTAGGYRYFTTDMLRDIAACCYKHHWYSFDEMKAVLLELYRDAHGGTGEAGILRRGPSFGHLLAEAPFLGSVIAQLCPSG